MDYKISEIARKCDVNKETIRYYERKGFIPAPYRTDSGYRFYPEDTVHRVLFIKRMQELGFTLVEIDKLLGVVDKDSTRCADMYDFVVDKIEEVQKRINDLQRIESMLLDLKNRCPDERTLHDCPIIETVMDGIREPYK